MPEVKLSTVWPQDNAKNVSARVEVIAWGICLICRGMHGADHQGCIK